MARSVAASLISFGHRTGDTLVVLLARIFSETVLERRVQPNALGLVAFLVKTLRERVEPHQAGALAK